MKICGIFGEQDTSIVLQCEDRHGIEFAKYNKNAPMCDENTETKSTNIHKHKRSQRHMHKQAHWAAAFSFPFCLIRGFPWMPTGFAAGQVSLVGVNEPANEETGPA